MKRSEQKKITRNKLFETAIRLFFQEGYDQVKVEDIVREAGVAKGTFYHHFFSKDAILVEYGNTIYESLLSEVIQILEAEEKEPQLQLEEIFQYFADFNITNYKGLVLFIRQSVHAGIVDPGFSSVSQELILYLTKLIDRGKETSIFRTKVESQRIATYLLNTYIQVCNQAFVETSEEQFSQVIQQRIDEILNIYLYGLLAS